MRPAGSPEPGRDAHPVAHGVLALAGAIAFATSHGVLRWLAGAALILGLPSVVAVVRRSAAWQRRRHRVPLALLVVVAVTLLWELVLGHPPASRDHAIHYFEIDLLVRELLPAGRVSGWTTRFNNGLAFGEAYPWLPHLWSAALHLASAGLVGLRESYAWGLLAVWGLALAGVWWVAAAIAGEIDGLDPQHVRWAGAIAALGWLLDPGASREGGWNYLMFHGVWPQSLSAALWVLSLPATWRALHRPSPRAIAIAALLLAGSLLAHPFGLLTMATSAVLWIAIAIATPAGRTLPRPWIVLAIVHAAATAIGMAWLASFLTGAEALGRSPVPWDALGVLGARALQGALFSAHWAWAGPLAVIGAIAALRRGAAFAWIVAGLVLAMIVLGSEAAITVLRLDLVAPGFKNLQFPRFSLGLKPLSFALAGVGAVVLGVALARHRATIPYRTWRERVLVAVLVAPVLATIAADPGWLVARPVGGVESLRAAAAVDDEAALQRALDDEVAALGERPLTVAFLREGMGGGMFPLMTIADAGGRAVLDGHVATINSEHRVDRRTPRGMLGLGVTHVLYDRALDESESALAEALATVGEYGGWTLARLQPPQPVLGTDRVSWTGDGSATVIEEAPGRWAFDVSGVSTPISLRLPDAPHPKWSAMLDGEPLAIEPAALWGGAATGMAIAIPRDGRVVVSYDDRPTERRARWIGALVAVACLASLGLARPLAAVARPASRRRRRIATAVLIAIGLAAAVAIVRRQALQLERTWQQLAAGVRGLDHGEDATLLADATVDDRLVVTRSHDAACVGVRGKDALDGCSEAQHRPHASFLFREPYLYRCTRFGLAPGTTATVEIADVPDDAWIVGAVVRVDRVGRGRDITFTLAGKTSALGNVVHELAVAPGSAADAAAIEVSNDAARPESVCIAAALVRAP